MKVSEIPYRRYTIEEGRAAYAAIEARLAGAKSGTDLAAARELYLAMLIEYTTAASLAHCRFTLDTRDEFYQGEVAYYDEVGPLFQEMTTAFASVMLDSPYRAEGEALIGPRVFAAYEIARKSFSPVITEDVQKENALTTEYSKLMSEMPFSFRGEEMPLSVLRGKLQDGDRDIRREAAEAIGCGLEANREVLDDIYDRLVKLRDGMAKKMGYENFVELGYYRMGRVDYNAEMVGRFRAGVARDLTPAVTALKREIAADLGIENLAFYDDAIVERGEGVAPKLAVDEIFAEALGMYREMHPDVGAFMAEMQENEAFDVLSRDGKWGGGYCTAFPKYKQPFILANFNGTAGDIDVMTHEFGHALAAHYVFEEGDIELDVGGMETAECHSMGMEFFSWPYMDRFFTDGNKYRRKHLVDALSFIPYGVIIDEFQEEVYSHPEYTPAERNALYLRLEEKYRPYLDFSEIPYLSEGTRWQYQMHVYEAPFYYIDYCLAQTVALGFLLASQKDYADAFSRYLTFVRAGGTLAFDRLVARAELPSPFEAGALEDLAEKTLSLYRDLKKDA